MKLNREEERPPAMNAPLAQPIRLQLTLTRFPSFHCLCPPPARPPWTSKALYDRIRRGGIKILSMHAEWGARREEERCDTAGEKSIVNATRKTRGAKNEPGRTIKGDGRGNGREGGGGGGLRSSCWVRPTIVSGTTLPSSARAAGRGRPRLAHYSKSGMQSRAAAAADNNFLGRTFLSPNFRVSSSVRSVRSAARSLPTPTARSSLL